MSISGEPDEVRVDHVSTDPRVAERLEAVTRAHHGEDAHGAPAIVVLPSRLREVGAYYSLDDVAAFKQARANGLDIVLADREVEYLHEHSAGWVGEVAIGVASELAANGVMGIATVLWLYARSALKREAHTASLESVPLKLTVVHQHQGKTGLETNSVEVVGAVAAIVEALPAVMAQLDSPGSNDPQDRSDEIQPRALPGDACYLGRHRRT